MSILVFADVKGPVINTRMLNQRFAGYNRYRNAGQNLRTQLERIIKRAALTPWPKLFEHLRSTREPQLAEVFPIHVVCKWIGNSQAVAKNYYLQVTEDHFAAAAGREKNRRKKRRSKRLQGDEYGAGFCAA